MSYLRQNINLYKNIKIFSVRYVYNNDLINVIVIDIKLYKNTKIKINLV